jgi:hypothetical protein
MTRAKKGSGAGTHLLRHALLRRLPAGPHDPVRRLGKGRSTGPTSGLLRDHGENGNDRILEDPAGIEVRLGETAITDAGVRVSRTPSRVKRSRDQNKSRSKRRCAASRNISRNSMRSRLAPDSRSAYSQEIVQPCFAANSRSCAKLVFDFLAFVSGAHTSIDRDSRVRLQFSHRILRPGQLCLGARSIRLSCAF